MGKKIIKTLSLGVLGGGKKKAADPASSGPQPEITPLGPDNQSPDMLRRRRWKVPQEGSILGSVRANGGSLSGTLGG